MRAQELQIGDWVGRVFDDNRIIEDYRQVDWIRTGEIGLRYQRVWSIGCIEPIPLTPKMLGKNGWKKHATYGTKDDGYIEEIYMLYQHSFEIVFEDKTAVSIRHFVSRDDDGYDKLLIEMHDNGNKPLCVHTLQHSLCLYGLDELADNFKI